MLFDRELRPLDRTSSPRTPREWCRHAGTGPLGGTTRTWISPATVKYHSFCTSCGDPPAPDRLTEPDRASRRRPAFQTRPSTRFPTRSIPNPRRSANDTRCRSRPRTPTPDGPSRRRGRPRPVRVVVTGRPSASVLNTQNSIGLIYGRRPVYSRRRRSGGRE
jgi:hypothetical protein